MEIPRLTLPPIAGPGDIITFYSFESSGARSLALSNMGHLLAGRQHATVPVLMIDWDLESPGLHHLFDTSADAAQRARPGLLEYFQACAEQIDSLAHSHPDADAEQLATLALAAVDWEACIERVDASRPLFLMRAGRFDDSYGERAGRLDWDGLFRACPALFRQFGQLMTRRFRHVLVDARCGRSAAVSVCTALLPHKLVALFTPNRRSLEGTAGVVKRAIAYRCTHEDEQRPLLVYPLPCAVDSGDCERRLHWRRGANDAPGYQTALETLLRACYGIKQLSLDSYFDEIQLQQTNAMASGEHLGQAPERDADRFSLTRTFNTLLDWVEEGRFPWQSHAEVKLLAAVDAARLQQGEGAPAAAAVLLAHELERLARLYLAQQRLAEARTCLEECLALRADAFGEHHAQTRASRAALAGLLLQLAPRAAKSFYEDLSGVCSRLAGADHPETLSARAGLAATLAQLGEFPRALTLHGDVIDACERIHGADHAATLDALAAQAVTLVRYGERSRARMVYECVLERRERLLGAEHQDTLRCMEQLAALLCDMGDLHHARGLQEKVLAARVRHAGPEHVLTLAAREALAEIVAAQGDLGAVRSLFMSLTQARARRYGSDHPDTLSTQLRLAATLGEEGEVAPVRARDTRPRSPEASRRAQVGADALETQLAQLEHLLGHGAPHDARALADALRKTILRPAVAQALRRRGAALIKQVYRRDNDTNALLAFTQDEVAALEGVLDESMATYPMDFS